MDGSFDLSKIISMVAENPQLVAGVKSLLESAANTDETNSEANTSSCDIPKENTHCTDETNHETSECESEPAFAGQKNVKMLRKRRRKELLCALKPYVCPERSKAIDTMLSLTEVLEVLKEN